LMQVNVEATVAWESIDLRTDLRKNDHMALGALLRGVS
jgi:hypothetical protein